jgi:hypothetical protein
MPPPLLQRALWTPPPATLPLINLLSGYWELNEATGSGARVDGSGNGLDLTASASVTAAAGIIGNCISTAGSNRVFHADHALLRGDGSWTLAAWLNEITGTGTAWQVVKGSSSTVFEYALVRTGDSFSLQIQNNTKSVTLTNAGLPTGTWKFLVGRYSIKNQRLSLMVNDGVRAISALAAVAIAGATGDFSMGMAGSSAGQTTKADQVGFWQRELSDADCSWLYAGGVGRTAAEVLAYRGVPAP